MNKGWNRQKIIFGCYCIVMLWLLYGQRVGSEAYTAANFVPFKTIGSYATVLLRTTDSAMLQHIIINLVGNVVMFVPLGYFFPVIWKRLQNFFWHFLVSVVMIAMIELAQYATMLGSMDIDDLILNLPGTMIGYVLWFLFSRAKK